MKSFRGTLTIEGHPAELAVSGAIGLHKGPVTSHYEGVVDISGPIDTFGLVLRSPDAVLDVEGGIKINVLFGDEEASPELRRRHRMVFQSNGPPLRD